jgi:hypothetical protein
MRGSGQRKPTSKPCKTLSVLSCANLVIGLRVYVRAVRVCVCFTSHDCEYNVSYGNDCRRRCGRRVQTIDKMRNRGPRSHNNGMLLDICVWYVGYREIDVLIFRTCTVHKNAGWCTRCVPQQKRQDRGGCRTARSTNHDRDPQLDGKKHTHTDTHGQSRVRRALRVLRLRRSHM